MIRIKNIEHWAIYIPEEGHYPIEINPNTTYEEARNAYLKWANRKRLPKGSRIERVI